MSAKQYLGSVARRAALGLAFGSLASIAFAWSISGSVANEDGAPLGGVTIASFNYSGISGITDDAGNFSLSNEGPSGILPSMDSHHLDVQYKGNLLSISNISGTVVKVSLMNALGKVAYQNEFSGTNAVINLKKFTNQNFMILKVNANGTNNNYVLTKQGAARVLRKEGDIMATFMFNLAGYEPTGYTMKAEVETDVKVVMKKASATSSSSESPWPKSSSSSVLVAESSSSIGSFVTGEDVKPATVLSPGNHNYTVDGRLIIVHVPSTYTGEKAVPMIVDYHPIGNTAGGWAQSATYESETAADQVIIVYPDGGDYPQGGMMNGGHAWNVGPCCSMDDDVAFSRKFIAEVKKVAYIDSKRIYATGYSMGGGMSNYAACKMADVYAAVAPASFDLSSELIEGKYDGCKPARPIPVLNFRGTGDFVVNYNGGLSQAVPGRSITFLGAENNMKKWAELNGCTGSAEQGVPENGCQMYKSCKDGVQVGLCTNKLGGSCSGNSHEAGCARIGWNFMKQFSMP